MITVTDKVMDDTTGSVLPHLQYVGVVNHVWLLATPTLSSFSLEHDSTFSESCENCAWNT